MAPKYLYKVVAPVLAMSMLSACSMVDEITDEITTAVSGEDNSTMTSGTSTAPGVPTQPAGDVTGQQSPTLTQQTAIDMYEEVSTTLGQMGGIGHRAGLENYLTDYAMQTMLMVEGYDPAHLQTLSSEQLAESLADEFQTSRISVETDGQLIPDESEDATLYQTPQGTPVLWVGYDAKQAKNGEASSIGFDSQNHYCILPWELTYDGGNWRFDRLFRENPANYGLSAPVCDFPVLRY